MLLECSYFYTISIVLNIYYKNSIHYFIRYIFNKLLIQHIL